jgi:hypothetical protein
MERYYIVKVAIDDSLRSEYQKVRERMEEKRKAKELEEQRRSGIEKMAKEQTTPEMHTKTYKNLSRRSGVDKYTYGKKPNGDDFIWIYFKGGSVYKYDTESAGREHMDKMLRNAARGFWLNRYVNKYKPNYYFKGRY